MSVRLGHAGLGYWGPNVARNFADLAEVRWLCDLSPEGLSSASERHTDARTTMDFD